MDRIKNYIIYILTGMSLILSAITISLYLAMGDVISITSIVLTAFIAILTFIIQRKQNELSENMQKIQLQQNELQRQQNYILKKQHNLTFYNDRLKIFDSLITLCNNIHATNTLPDDVLLIALDNNKIELCFDNNIAVLSAELISIIMMIQKNRQAHLGFGGAGFGSAAYGEKLRLDIQEQQDKAIEIMNKLGLLFKNEGFTGMGINGEK